MFKSGKVQTQVSDAYKSFRQSVGNVKRYFSPSTKQTVIDSLFSIVTLLKAFDQDGFDLLTPELEKFRAEVAPVCMSYSQLNFT